MASGAPAGGSWSWGWVTPGCSSPPTCPGPRRHCGRHPAGAGQRPGARQPGGRPAGWRRNSLVPLRRFRRLDRVRVLHGKVTGVDLPAQTVDIDDADGGATDGALRRAGDRHRGHQRLLARRPGRGPRRRGGRARPRGRPGGRRAHRRRGGRQRHRRQRRLQPGAAATRRSTSSSRATSPAPATTPTAGRLARHLAKAGVRLHPATGRRARQVHRRRADERAGRVVDRPGAVRRRRGAVGGRSGAPNTGFLPPSCSTSTASSGWTSTSGRPTTPRCCGRRRGATDPSAARPATGATAS